MLPPKQTFFWQQLSHLLSSLESEEKDRLRAKLQEAIEIFEGQILPQHQEDELSPPVAAKMRSYVTESHRLLRLLQMDVMFLQAARNSLTSQQRYDAYQERLNTLIKFCQAAIEVSSQ
jgi:hypothetical protein